MPRRNLLALLTVTLVALLCYQRVQRNPYGRVLGSVISKIENQYIDPIRGPDLFEAAMDGMVGKLDENSAFIPASVLPAFRKEIDQEFGGVGIEVAMDPQTRQLTVLSPLVGSPGYKAGIRAGDRIVRIGEVSTQGMSLKDAVALLTGKVGKAVTLTILHEGEDKPTEIRVVREKIQVPTVQGDTRNADGSWNFFLGGRNRIGYIRVTSFTDKTADDLKTALDWLTVHEIRGLVLDLRDDPGGYLDAAVDVCDMLIDSGVIVTTRRRGGRISETYAASERGPFTDFPVVVLVNQHSASAAEIVAACLQDHHRATTVGQRSYGKGTVQEVVPLEEGCGAMKITTASYWRPSGKNIQRPREAGANTEWGVSPDEGCKVVLTDNEQSQWQQWRSHRDAFQPGDNRGGADNKTESFVDRQLVKAVECLEKAGGSREKEDEGRSR